MRPDLHISEDMTLDAAIVRAVADKYRTDLICREHLFELDEVVRKAYGIPVNLINNFLVTSVRTATGYDFMHGNMHLI